MAGWQGEYSAIDNKKYRIESSMFPSVAAAAIIGTVVLLDSSRVYVLIALMLFLPLADRQWKLRGFSPKPVHIAVWTILTSTIAGLLLWQPQILGFTVSTVLLVALPEEWFFRAYFMTRLGQGWRANLIASFLFALLHGLTQGWPAAVRVFAPSLFYGWLYQRTRDLPLLVLVHALSNLVFAMFFEQFIADFTGNSR